MATLRVRGGKLHIDFRYRGIRCRETTYLADTPEHRAEVRRRVRQIDGEIAPGTFEYGKWFPRGPRAALFAPPAEEGPPQFKAYVLRWLEDKAARIGAGTAYDRRRIVEGKLIPFFGDRRVSDITEEDVEAFIANLKRTPAEDPEPAATAAPGTKQPPRKRKLSNRRVNIILQVLRQSLDRAVKRGWLETNPGREVERLREDKVEILPFSFEEVRLFLDKGLMDEALRRYFTVAFFSGLRPSEQMGLRWDDIDWHRKLIGVRRAVTRWGEATTKTVGSSRDADMQPPVERALQAQRAASQLRSPWVFPNTQGGTLDITNLRERVWRPALRRAGLRYRTMYQTRHTFATLALSSGEDIGWVARMLGHTSTEMVIRRYYRFVPNLTRRDGSALSRLSTEKGF
jgi:integrase